MNSRFFLVLGVCLVCCLGIACAYSLAPSKNEDSLPEELIHQINATSNLSATR